MLPARVLRAVFFKFSHKYHSNTKSSLVYGLIRPFMLIIMCLLFACTFIDILRQSFSSGQFWNSIIVIAFLGASALWSFLLHFFRFIHVNRWLNAIPRPQQLSKSDIGQSMLNKIGQARYECMQKFKSQIDFSRIEHPGLQNPLNGSMDIGVPYWELFEIVPLIIEEHLTESDSDFDIPEDMCLREYLDLAFQRQALPAEATEVANRFVDLYEYFRYSGRNVDQQFLQDLMVCLQHLVRYIQPPLASPSQESLQTRISLSNSSSYSMYED